MKYRPYTVAEEPLTGRGVELRVHGVGGTPPESILDDDDPMRVRGDDTAGFYRRREPAEGGHTLEAYSWGGLTSRTASRAFWVALLPFALHNLAGWMIPAGRSREHPGWAHGLSIRAVRVSGILMTSLLVLWIGQISIETVALQCGASARCLDTNAFLGIFEVPFFAGAPGRRMVVGSLLPVAMIIVFLLLGRVSRGRYEAEYPFQDPAEEFSVDAIPQPSDDSLKNTFADSTFWKRSESIKAFTKLHLSAAISSLAVAVAVTLIWLYRKEAEPQTLAMVLAWAVLVLGAVAFLLSMFAVAFRASEPLETPNASATKLLSVLEWMSIGTLLLGFVVAVLWPSTDVHGQAPYRGAVFAFALLAVAAVVFHIVGLAFHPDRGSKIPSPFDTDTMLDAGFWGWGSTGAILLGYLLMGTVLTGLGAAAARLLGGRANVAYPAFYDAVAVGATVLVLLFVVYGVVSVVRRIRDTPLEALNNSLIGEAPAASEGAPRPPAPPLGDAPPARVTWIKSIRRMRAIRKSVPVLEKGLLVAVAVPLVVVVADSVMRLFGSNASTTILDVSPGWFETATFWLLAVGLPGTLYLVVRRSLSNRTARKTVGVFWDVTTFWPRWFHPLAPPSYAGRAIPELRTRLDVLARANAEWVVLSSHSQGTVLVLAALDGLLDRWWFRRIGVITFGSPISRLYYRYFPAHVGPAITRLATATQEPERDLPRWINLYRLTDPIGGAIAGERDTGTPITAPAVAPDGGPAIRNPLRDPDTSAVRPESRFPWPGNPYPKPSGHSDYYDTPEYARALVYVKTLQDEM